MDQAYRRKCYEHVFLNQKSGNSSNSGKTYVRPYKKTKTEKKGDSK